MGSGWEREIDEPGLNFSQVRCIHFRRNNLGEGMNPRNDGLLSCVALVGKQFRRTTTLNPKLFVVTV